MSEESFENCEVCGKPATNMVADLYEWDNYDSGLREFATARRHRYCDEHHMPSERINISVSPLTWANQKERGVDPYASVRSKPCLPNEEGE